jgi:hypothetical protein
MMRSTTLITHAPIAIAIIILSLFQMAMLVAYMSTHSGRIQNAEENVHTDHDQQRRGSKYYVGEDLR